MTSARRAARLCVLALLASALLFASPAFAAEDTASDAETATSEVAAFAPSASVRASAVSDAVAPEAAPEVAASSEAAVVSAEAFAAAPAPATAEQFGESSFVSLFERLLFSGRGKNDNSSKTSRPSPSSISFSVTKKTIQPGGIIGLFGSGPGIVGGLAGGILGELKSFFFFLISVEGKKA